MTTSPLKRTVLPMGVLLGVMTVAFFLIGCFNSPMAGRLPSALAGPTEAFAIMDVPSGYRSSSGNKRATGIIWVSPSSRHCSPGNPLFLNARTNSNARISYRSSNMDIAGVTSTGKVVAGPMFWSNGGSATITISTCATARYSAATKYVTVYAERRDNFVTIGQPTRTYQPGQSFSLRAQARSGGKLSYASSNWSVLEVSNTGVVKVKDPGNKKTWTGYITVSVGRTNGYKNASTKVKITVKKGTPRIQLNVGKKSCLVWDSFYVSARADTGGQVIIRSGDNRKLTIKGNTAYTHCGGTVKITAYVGSTKKYVAGSKSISINIKKHNPLLTVSPVAGSIYVNKGIQMKASRKSTGRITYSVSNSAIASVSSGGYVKAKQGGTVTVTASVKETDAYRSASKKVKITVLKLTPTLSTAFTGRDCHVGSSFSIGAKSNSGGKITYATIGANKSYLSVSSKGKVTANNPGNKASTPVTVRVSCAATPQYKATYKDVKIIIKKDKTKITAPSRLYTCVGGNSVTIKGVKRSGDGKITYSTSSKYLTVSSSGKVTAKDIGDKTSLKATVAIKVAASRTYLGNSCNVTVVIKKFKPTITTSMAKYVCEAGKTISLGAKISNSGQQGALPALSYKSSSGYLTVKNNKATAKSNGHWTNLMATVTITSANTASYVSASKTVTVILTKEYGGTLTTTQQGLATTALEFGSIDKVVPEGNNPYSKPSSEFDAYVAAHDSVSGNIDDTQGVWANLWASCDAGVATVIQSSGIDPSFPGYDPPKQRNYCEQSSKWKNAGTWAYGESCEKLQPGDVLITVPANGSGRNSHIKMFIGNSTVRQTYPNSDANMYAASSGQYYPHLYNESYSGDTRLYSIYRYCG